MLPKVFKGIALFTPGGDLIYAVDPHKQTHWHVHLCTGLQQILNLPEPPHFLIPSYTATIDRWQDPVTQKLRIAAELYPAVQRYQELLNTIFEIQDLTWQTAAWQEELCNPIILETYRDRFPQLWEDHDLILCYEFEQQITDDWQSDMALPLTPELEHPYTYVFRLFVSGNSSATERTLKSIHQLLEQGLRHPYTLKVIDIFQHPEQAEINQVSATPTLVRVWPRPVRRIIGELDNLPKVLQILGSY